MKAEKPMMLREVMDEYGAGAEAMVRTQVYLSRAEHDFLLSESGRRGITMAGLIRSIVDEKMAVPDRIWENNPLLEDAPVVEGFGHEDGSRNHDHYIYGSPKIEDSKPLKRRRR